MQRFARIHRLVVVPSVMLLAVSALAPAAILCVGSGSHLAIEAASAGCCDPAMSRGHSGQSAPDGERCSDDCTDTAVGVYATWRSPEHVTAVHHAVMLGVVPRFVAAPGAAPLAGRPVWNAPFSRPPRALRTTVIIC